MSAGIVSEEQMTSTLAKIQAALELSAGRLICPSDPIYEDSRKIYNRFHDHKPAALVQTRSIEALRRTIDIAAEASVEIAIRGGGHHIGGLGTTHGGIVLDFSPFREVVIDRERGCIRVAPGARLHDLDAATVPAGWVVPTGTVSQTGVAGLALGGGKGWFTGPLGLTCDQLIGADVLTADGAVVKAEDAEHTQLLWALRGGGGNFGVVLEFRFQLNPLPKTYCGSLLVDWGHAQKSLGRLLDYLGADCPKGLTTAPVFLRNASGHNELQIDFCYAGGDRGLLQPLLNAVQPTQEREVRYWNFANWQSNFDAYFMPPMRGYWKASYRECLSETAVSALIDAYERAPGKRCSVTLEHLHGAYHEFDASHGAFGHRDAGFGVLASCRWEDAKDDDTSIAWVRQVIAAVDPTGESSSYLNYSALGDGRKVEQLYGSNLKRLLEVKRAYDPNNVFRRNHNIRSRGAVL